MKNPVLDNPDLLKIFEKMARKYCEIYSIDADRMIEVHPGMSGTDKIVTRPLWMNYAEMFFHDYVKITIMRSFEVNLTDEQLKDLRYSGLGNLVRRWW